MDNTKNFDIHGLRSLVRTSASEMIGYYLLLVSFGYPNDCIHREG